jgi:ZIP family zinc transporter
LSFVETDNEQGGDGTLSFFQTVILGGIAGLTIFLGLPLARLRLESLRYLSLLNAFAIGILLFLFIEVM